MNNRQSIFAGLVGLIFIFLLGYASGYKYRQLYQEPKLISSDTTVVRDTVMVSDTIYLPSPERIVRVDSLKYDGVNVANSLNTKDTSESVHITNITGELTNKDLILTWGGKLAVINNDPRIFDVVYKYQTICPIIKDSVFITNTKTITNTIQVKRPVNYLSIGAGLTFVTESIKLDLNYHHGWYYIGTSIGLTTLTPGEKGLFVGVNAGININL